MLPKGIISHVLPLILLGAVVLGACSHEQDMAATASEPFLFTVEQSSAFTRFAAGNQDMGTIKRQGFGVFAYTTGTADFADALLKSEFMANQLVLYSGIAWYYSPLKYWPNQEGEKVTVFAYAPYNNPTAAPQDLTLIPTAEATQPKVSYRKFRTKVSDTDHDANGPLTFFDIHENEATDLLWATPVTNATKPGVSASVSLVFNHALAQLGFKVKKTVGVTGTVVIRELRLTGNFYREGVLDITTGEWTDCGGVGDEKLQEEYVFHLNQTVTETATELSDAIPLLMLPQDFSLDETSCISVTYTVGETWHEGVERKLKDLLGSSKLVQGNTTWLTMTITDSTP